MPAQRPLAGRHALVTAGPTHEPIDPVRYIANRSAASRATPSPRRWPRSARAVTLVSGPVAMPDPPGVAIASTSRPPREMLAACEAALPADVAVLRRRRRRLARRERDRRARSRRRRTAARPASPWSTTPTSSPPSPAPAPSGPRLVVGFAAETNDVDANATAKLARKGCDWIVANDVSPATGIMGGDENAVLLVTADGAETWPRLAKEEVAKRLAARIAETLAAPLPQPPPARGGGSSSPSPLAGEGRGEGSRPRGSGESLP